MPTLDLKNVSKESIQNLCEFYLEYMRDQNADSSVRKVKNNLSKISLEHDTKLIDQAMIIAENAYNNNPRQSYIDIRSCIDKYYPIYQQKVREEIRSKSMDLYHSLKSLEEKDIKEKILYYSRNTLDNIYKDIDKLEMKQTFGIWTNHYSTFLYLDVSCWIILQTVIYSIIRYNNSTAKTESIEQINIKVKNLISNFERKSVACSENIFLTYSEYLLFSIFRSYFMQDTNVLRKLENECSDMSNPEKKYSLIEYKNNKKEVTDDKRIYFYLERTEIDKKEIRTFNTNYKKCVNFITLYNKETGRNLKCDDLTLKAIYRQLILDQALENRRKSKIIFNNFIKTKQFSNYSEYYFINEKINLGMFREYGLLKEYLAKNDLQENLYILVSLLLTPEEIYQEAKQNFNEIYSVLNTQVKKNRLLRSRNKSRLTRYLIKRDFFLYQKFLSSSLNFILISLCFPKAPGTISCSFGILAFPRQILLCWNVTSFSNRNHGSFPVCCVPIFFL